MGCKEGRWESVGEDKQEDEGENEERPCAESDKQKSCIVTPLFCGFIGRWTGHFELFLGLDGKGGMDDDSAIDSATARCRVQ